MKKTFLMLIAVAAFSFTMTAQSLRDGFETYTLKNGMKVYLWVDKDWTDVYGQVTVRAGSIDEPADFTGLAHYLEHELFKGTQQIGALNWEKEKPLYEEIISLYDECAAAGFAKNEAKKEELIKKINEKSIETAKLSRDDDFSTLIQGIGGYDLNAYTNFDETAYHNAFPTHQMEKWLTIYTDRLINPVFRSFQAELENVFEEYNMRMPNVDAQQSQALFEHAFKGTPYARDVIGTVEHLKNPSMSPMIKFFNDWYVPNNMALILVGNFDKEAVKPLIEKTFGKLEYKELPARVPVVPQNFAGIQPVKVKIGYEPSIILVFDGIKEGHPDQLKLEMLMMCLNNGQGVGLFDKLNLDNTVGGVGAGLAPFREMGIIYVSASPYMDLGTGTFESDKKTEQVVMAEINRLKKGNIPSWLFQSVKEQYLQEIKQMNENPMYKVSIANTAFISQQDVEKFFNIEEKVKAITIDDLKEVAAKYFDKDYLSISFSEGEPKIQKLKKPNIKPLIERPDGQETAYGKYFQELPEGEMFIKYEDFSEVKHKELYKNVDLYYNENPKNDIFTLILEYGVGNNKMPKLEYAAQLMNYAGGPGKGAQDIRRELGRLGATCGFGSNDNYFYIQIEGEEKNLQKIMDIVTRQTLMPRLDNRVIEGVLWETVSSRMYEQRRSSSLTAALWQYIQYGDKSPYIDRTPSKSLIKIGVAGEEATINPLVTNTDLTTTIQDATSYAVKMYYTGQKPLEEVAEILEKVSPIKENMKPKEPEFFRKRVDYTTPQIYFLPNSEIQQATVFMYIPIGKDYNKSKMAKQAAFNEYFNGGFAGLVMHEIREKRSLAYGAGGNASGSLKTKDQYFVGSVGTQNDKVLEVINTYVDLLQNMPLFPERIKNIKNQLKATIIGTMNFRGKAMNVEKTKELGFNEDPAKYLLPQYDNLKFEDITDFYNTNIKNKPLIIVIHGDPKLINIKEIQKKYGKVTKLTKSKLFKGSEFWF